MSSTGFRGSAIEIGFTPILEQRGKPLLEFGKVDIPSEASTVMLRRY